MDIQKTHKKIFIDKYNQELNNSCVTCCSDISISSKGRRFAKYYQDTLAALDDVYPILFSNVSHKVLLYVCKSCVQILETIITKKKKIQDASIVLENKKIEILHNIPKFKKTFIKKNVDMHQNPQMSVNIGKQQYYQGQNCHYLFNLLEVIQLPEIHC